MTANVRKDLHLPPPTKIWLMHTEPILKKQIDSGEMPFLGLYSDLFNEGTRERLRKIMSTLVDPFQFYLNALKHWPAIFATYLTVNVVEGYGAEGTAAVYPYVTTAIFGTTRELTQSEREDIWQAYRQACIRLGLDIVPEHSVNNYMVAEYLHQAGVPFRYIPDLTRKMLAHTIVAGLPEIDDPQGISLWQEALIERLGSPLPVTVGRAVQADSNGFYARLFLRVLKGDAITKIRIATRMAETINEPDQFSDLDLSRRLSIPKVIWRDDLLGIELPQGDGIFWTIKVDGISRDHQGASESRFVPFDFPPLPGKGQVSRRDGDLIKTFSLWEDGRNNRFLAFDATGLLCASGHLNMAEPLPIDPGLITLVTRFRPDEYSDEIVEISPDPALYCFVVTLAPSESLVLRRGAAETRLIGRGRPTLSFVGTSFRGIGGNELYASAGLRLRGQVPRELLTEPDEKLTLALTAPGLGPDLEIPVILENDGRFDLNLEATTSRFKFGLTRLGLELRRFGIQRPMARLANFFWHGLKKIDDRVRFSCTVLPFNLDRDHSENLMIDETNREISYRNDINRFFRFVFKLESSRSIQFTGVVPGAFMVLKRYREGQVSEMPLRKGSVLAVRSNAMEVLEVHSSQGGTLSLGRFQQEIPSGIGMRRIHLSALAEYLEPGQNRLRIDLPSGTTEPLLDLVTPHFVLGMTTLIQSNLLQVKLLLPASIEAIRCSGSDLLTGKTLDLDLLCNDVESHLDRSTLVWLSCHDRQDHGQFLHVLELPLERWPTGAWLLQVEVRLQGRWGALVNEREDNYAWGFVINETGAQGNNQWLLAKTKKLGTAWCAVIDETSAQENHQWLSAKVRKLSTDDLMAVFKRVHIALLACYAPDVWEGIAWLKKVLWYRGVQVFSPASGQILTELVTLDALDPPLTAQVSWFPLLSIGAEIPWIYMRESGAYRGLGRRGGLLCELSNIRHPLCDLFLKPHLEQTLAFGFRNVKQMQRGTPPKGFNLKNYRDALMARNIDDAWAQLRREDWQPTAGDFLGPVHWRYALGNLERRYHDTLAGNNARRGWAMQLVRSAKGLTLGNLVQSIPTHLDDVSGLGLMTSPPYEGWSQEQENLLMIDRMICLFAAICRWESRHAGALNTWQQTLRRMPFPDPNAIVQAMSYLLYVARDIFEFYLILWELVFTADADTYNGDATHG